MTESKGGTTLDERGAWLGVVVGALGWTLTALVLARGGGYFVVVPHLAFVLPLALVGTVTALASSGVGLPAVTPTLWLLVIILAGVFCNFLIFWFRFGSATWGLLMPLAKPTGLDFRDGLYQPALDFTTLKSGWPPFTLIVGKPFTLFGFSTAHVIELVLLAAAAVASVVLCAVLAVRVAPAARRERTSAGAPNGSRFSAAGGTGMLGERPVGTVQLALVAGLWLFTSVGFIFEMERGNIDLFAIAFALLAVWLMLGRRSPWWPALALAVSINLKLYPGVLLALLLWRYRWKALVPAVVTNVALLLIAGPQAIRDTITGQIAVEDLGRPYQWPNHSAASLSVVLRRITTWAPSWIYWPLLLVPLAIWIVTMAVLVRRGWSARTGVIGAAACVPLMGVVPAVSVEYKLVIYVFPLTVLVAVAAAAGRRRTLVWSVRFGLVAWAMIMLSRSSAVVNPSLQSSKYALLVLLQVLLLVAAWGAERATTAEDTR